MDQKSSNIFWNRCIIGLAEIDITGKFLKANPAFCSLLGYNESELQQKNWKDITHPEDAEGCQIMLERMLSNEIDNYSMEKRYITKKGQVIWVTIFLSSILDDNQHVKLLIKQVLSVPVAIVADAPNQSIKNRRIFKDNIKIILAAIIGGVFIIYGASTGNPEIQNLGIAMTVGVFGGMMVKK